MSRTDLFTAASACLALLLLSACMPVEVSPVPPPAEATAAPAPPPAPVDLQVSRAQGALLDEPGRVGVYIPPSAVEGDTRLRVVPISAPPPAEGTEPAGAAYDITLREGKLQQPIEIALPYAGGAPERAFIATYAADAGWTPLDSWYGGQDRRVHARVDSLAKFGVFTSLFARPQLTNVHAEPALYTDVGSDPICIREDLAVHFGVDDPDQKAASARLRFSFNTFLTAGVFSMVEQVTAWNGLGLMLIPMVSVVPGTAPAAIMPAVEALWEMGTTKESQVVSGWLGFDLKAEPDAEYVAALNTTGIGSCGGRDVDEILKSVGIEAIVATVELLDSAGNVLDTQDVRVPVFPDAAIFAKLTSPGGEPDDVVSPRPTFAWSYSEAGAEDLHKRLWYAPGDSLWDKVDSPLPLTGRKSVEFDYPTAMSWTPSAGQELAAGDYSWGIEMARDAEFKDYRTRSEVYQFTVSEDWADLAVDGTVVTWSQTFGSFDEGKLRWRLHSLKDGLSERALAADPHRLDLAQDLQSVPDLIVWLESSKDGAYRRVSPKVSVAAAGCPARPAAALAWGCLRADGTVVTRTEVSGSHDPNSLTWVVTAKGVPIYSASAVDATQIDLAAIPEVRDYYSGDFYVHLEATANGVPHTWVSNEVHVPPIPPQNPALVLPSEPVLCQGQVAVIASDLPRSAAIRGVLTDPAGAQVDAFEGSSDEQGNLTLTLVMKPTYSAGKYSVILYSGSALLAQGTFEYRGCDQPVEQPSLDAVLDVVYCHGEQQFVGKGLKPNTSYTLLLRIDSGAASAGVLEIEATADELGKFTVSYSLKDLPAGNGRVWIDGLAVEDRFTHVLDGCEPPSVTPPSGPVPCEGTATFTVDNLVPRSDIQVMFWHVETSAKPTPWPTGDRFSYWQRALSSGSMTILLPMRKTDPAGEWGLVLYNRDPVKLAETGFTYEGCAEPPSNPVIDAVLDPLACPGQQEVKGTGLTPDTAYSVRLRYAGTANVPDATWDVTTDPQGEFSLWIDMGDRPAGSYYAVLDGHHLSDRFEYLPCEPPPDQTTSLIIGVQPDPIVCGGEATIRAEGFKPGERVNVSIVTSTLGPGEVVADGRGRVQARFTMPTSWPGQAMLIEVRSLEREAGTTYKAAVTGCTTEMQ
jgi:hypothetical protein